MRPESSSSITVATLRDSLRAPFPTTLVDVRRRAAFERDPVRIPMALRREPETVASWAAELEPWRPVVVYCVHGHEVSQNAATALRERGFDARFLDGGVTQWRDDGLAVEDARPPTQWVTRARPKIDRIACPWFVRRFIDASAQIHYVAPSAVLDFAREHEAIPFDVPDVDYSHAGERCSFDAFVARHVPDDTSLRALADIVRAADTDTLNDSPQAHGLLAVSLGLGCGLTDDQALMKHGFLVYDALYAWCRESRGERHGWDANALRSQARQ
ncbi:MAG TPA: chromate resistance protein ChrB domain-containing protein [Casimicrobiaceae bacterium]|nr:chromate resistance protein ChrB domain-containing protein [Casimicrobiaceae bacterium]